MGQENREISQELKNGPLEKRECRDILCCLMFLANVGILWYLFAYGIMNNNIYKLMSGFDSNSAQLACGVDPSVKSYPYLYFPDPVSQKLNGRVCVQKCPSVGSQTINYFPTSIFNSTNTVLNMMTTNLVIGSTTTYFYLYDSKLLFNKVCVPTSIAPSMTSFSTTISSSLGSTYKYTSDIMNAYYVILIAMAAAVLIGFIYLMLLKCIAGLIVFLTINVYLGGLGFLGYLLYKQGTTVDPTGTDNTQMQYIAYAIWAFDALSLIIILCARKTLQLAVAIVKTAGQFVNDVKSVLVVPLIAQVFVIGFFIAWLIGFCLIYSSGTITGTPTLPFASVTLTENQQGYLWYYLFGGLWFHAFIGAMTQFVIASACAMWYFSQGTGQTLHLPVTNSFYRAFRYHLGSLAFGAFLLALVRFIQIVLYYIQQQVKKAGGNNNKVTLCILKCLSCYMACFERFIEFLNKNAYIQIALTGKNFCCAAKDAFSLILSNLARFAILGPVGGTFKFIGVLIISGSGTAVCYLICTYYTNVTVNIYSPIAPTIASGIICSFIAILFMTVYGMGIDTILQCFILDESLAKANGNEPQHTPDTLRDIMDDINKK